MTQIDSFLLRVHANGGFIRSCELRERQDYLRLLKATEDGKLVRLRRGLYALDDALANVMIDVERFVPAGVICLYSAFEHYNLSTFIPTAYCIAVESKRKVRIPDYPLIDIYYWKKENLEFGVVKSEISWHNVFITDIERTVCDAVKYRNKIGLDVCNEVFNSYVANYRLNITTLRKYAAKLRVLNVIDRYLEIKL